MSDEVQVILDLSADTQTLLDQQEIDLPHELQRELPSLRISYQGDPTATTGSKDIVAVITATAALIAAISPIILRILDMIRPPTQSMTWTIEEHQDGTKVRRLQVFSSRERDADKSQSKPPEIEKP